MMSDPNLYVTEPQKATWLGNVLAGHLGPLVSWIGLSHVQLLRFMSPEEGALNLKKLDQTQLQISQKRHFSLFYHCDIVLD